MSARSEVSGGQLKMRKRDNQVDNGQGPVKADDDLDRHAKHIHA